MKASVSVMFEGSRMAALLHPEARESKEKVGPRCVSGAFFSEGLMKWQEMLELAAVAFVGSLLGSLLVKVITLASK